MGNNVFHWQRYRWIWIWTRSQKSLAGFVNNTAQTIKVGSIGSIEYENKHSDGYYMVVLSSSPYTIQENKTIKGKFIYSSELVFNRMYVSPARSN